MSKKGFMKTKNSRFDRLVARYYPAVYSFAARLTDDPRDAVALTRIQQLAQTIAKHR
jgi:DNA-directed RNA polymerase specialized sigma24 family protein